MCIDADASDYDGCVVMRSRWPAIAEQSLYIQSVTYYYEVAAAGEVASKDGCVAAGEVGVAMRKRDGSGSTGTDGTTNR